MMPGRTAGEREPGSTAAGRLCWLAVGEHELPPGPDWLSPAEAHRLAAQRFPKRRTEYLLRRWAGKRAVAAVTGRPLDAATLCSVELLNHPTGAPWVRLDGCPAPLELSLTDRAGWAVCLVGAPDGAGAVGVDLELVEPRSDGFVEDFLTEAEQRRVRACPPGDSRDAAANLVWSAKESALKVLRTGLRADTRTVEVSVAGWPASSAAPGDGRWHPLEVRWTGGATFPGRWRRDGVFLLTVVTQRPVPPPEPLPGTADLGRAVPVHGRLPRPS